MFPFLEKTMATRGYSLVGSEEISSLQDDNPHGRQGKKIKLVGRVKSLAFWLFILISVGMNFILLIKSKHRSDMGRSPFSGLGYDTPTVFRSPTDWWGENESLSEELWEHLDTSPMAVALTDDYAKSHDLPIASRFPWDDNKGTYFIKAFHQLHCLKLMRRKVVDLQVQRESPITWEHYQHCLDALRQDIMCRADDTPMPGIIGEHLGNGQTVMCRDWNKLVAWTQAPPRQACYRSLDDYKSVVHSLERHAFCPESSEYYEVQRAYFNKWGHRDPFVQ